MSVAPTNIEEKIKALKTRAFEAIDPSKTKNSHETYYNEYASWYEQNRDWEMSLEGLKCDEAGFYYDSNTPKFKYWYYNSWFPNNAALLEAAAKASFFYSKCSKEENLLSQLQAKKVEVDSEWHKELGKLPKWVVGQRTLIYPDDKSSSHLYSMVLGAKHVTQQYIERLKNLPSEPTLPAPTQMGDTPNTPEEVIRAQSDVTNCQNRVKLFKEYYEKEMQRFETLMQARNSEEQQVQSASSEQQAQPLVFSSQSAATSSLSQKEGNQKTNSSDQKEEKKEKLAF